VSLQDVRLRSTLRLRQLYLDLSQVACSGPMVPGEEALARVDVTSTATSGLGAAENFLKTWNTRDAETWAESLRFPHARPTVGAHRKRQSKADYVATVDYARVIATG